MKTALKPATVREQQRIVAMLRLGCVACAVIGIPNGKDIECHHIVRSSRRMGHWYTLPLCVGHHRGYWSTAMLQVIPKDKRVGIYSGSKAFSREYGTERELWVLVQERLHLPAIWPPPLLKVVRSV